MAIATTDQSATSVYTHEPYRVSVEEYIRFRQKGILVVRGLVAPEEIAELREHTEDLMQGRLPEQQGHTLDGPHSGPSGTMVQALAAPPAHLSPQEKGEYFLRLHMLHRQLELHERYLLHPRVLDVLQALIGPDLLALQTMLFLKGPGKPGQGWHQDSYYIPTAVPGLLSMIATNRTALSGTPPAASTNLSTRRNPATGSAITN
jgi:hypothetical protein